MTTPEAGRPRSPATTEQVDAVMQAAHALAGITAQSVAEVEDRVTLPQLRVLILIGEDAGLNLSTLARALGVHPPNASAPSPPAGEPPSPPPSSRYPTATGPVN